MMTSSTNSCGVIAHFAIHANDVARARRFYEKVFGWRFEPWGPPDFFLIQTSSDENQALGGALQKRTGPSTAGGVNGYECTISVADLDKTIDLIKKNGGEVLSKPLTIPKVGTVVKFRDTEDNTVCAMRYDKNAQ